MAPDKDIAKLIAEMEQLQQQRKAAIASAINSAEDWELREEMRKHKMEIESELRNLKFEAKRREFYRGMNDT